MLWEESTEPLQLRIYNEIIKRTYIFYIVTDLINALPGNRFVNTVQHATIEEAVFSVDPTDVEIDWLDSDHVMCLL
jgi:hypothetical protein